MARDRGASIRRHHPRTTARRCGLTRSPDRLRIGRTARARCISGVFRVAGSYPSARQRAMAACLWCGPTTRCCRTRLRQSLSAAGRSGDETLHVTVPRFGASGSADGVTRSPNASIVEPRDRFVVDGLAVHFADSDDHRPRGDARRRRARARVRDAHGAWVSSREPCSNAAPSCATRSAGVARLRELLRVVGPTAEGIAPRGEVRRGCCAARGLRARRSAASRRSAFGIDFVVARDRIVGVECDGFDWHGNRLAWKRDRRRYRAARSARAGDSCTSPGTT